MEQARRLGGDSGRAPRRHWRRAGVVAASVAALAIASAGWASAGTTKATAIPDANGAMHGCYPTNGPFKPLYLVDPADGTACPLGFTATTFNAQGQRGPRGTRGPKGEQGPQGEQGPKGDPGASGPPTIPGQVSAEGVVDQTASGVELFHRLGTGEYHVALPPGSFEPELLPGEVGFVRDPVMVATPWSPTVPDDPAPEPVDLLVAGGDLQPDGSAVFDIQVLDQDGQSVEHGFTFLVTQQPPLHY